MNKKYINIYKVIIYIKVSGGPCEQYSLVIHRRARRASPPPPGLSPHSGTAILFTCLALTCLVSNETMQAHICYKIKIAKAYYCLKLNGIMTSNFFLGRTEDRIHCSY